MPTGVSQLAPSAITAARSAVSSTSASCPRCGPPPAAWASSGGASIASEPWPRRGRQLLEGEQEGDIAVAIQAA